MEKKESGESLINNKKIVKRKRRFKLGCIGIIFSLMLVCCSILSFIWLAGYGKKWTCSIVENDSFIAEKISCQNNIKQEGEGEYKYNVLDGGGNVQVTDLEQIVTQVVEDSSASVVGIGIAGDIYTEDQIIGTGFIVSENGLIVTNQHVVSAASNEQDLFVAFKDSEQAIPVEKIYRDQINDIAIIKIDKSGLPALPLGDSESLKVGQTVIAIGNSLGELKGTVTQGIISGLDREVQVGGGFFNSTVESYEDVIQTDAAINPGNSGGPLFNSQGEVIGVNFATIQGADNLSFALPINRVKSRIDELNEYGDFRIPFLGIEYRQRLVFLDNQRIIGAQIVSVLEGGPAEKGGLKEGDVIVQFNGSDLESNSLFNLIQKANIGESVEIVVIRNREQITLNVEVGQRGLNE